MSDQGAEQRVPSRRGRRSVSWRRDPVIQVRLRDVERRHLAGATNVAIATALGVDETTVRRDLDRLSELWVEQTQAQQASQRARIVAELEDVRVRALEAAEWDQMCERAVLFDDLDDDQPADDASDAPAADADADDDAAAEPALGRRRSVYRDHKGSAQFRGNKAAALAQARAATMDKAKVLGIAVEKHEHTGPLGGPLFVDHRVTDLSDDELDRRLAELDERAASLLAGAQGRPAPDPGGAGAASGGTGAPAP